MKMNCLPAPRNGSTRMPEPTRAGPQRRSGGCVQHAIAHQQAEIEALPDARYGASVGAVGTRTVARKSWFDLIEVIAVSAIGPIQISAESGPVQWRAAWARGCEHARRAVAARIELRFQTSKARRNTVRSSSSAITADSARIATLIVAP